MWKRASFHVLQETDHPGNLGESVSVKSSWRYLPVSPRRRMRTHELWEPRIGEFGAERIVRYDMHAARFVWAMVSLIVCVVVGAGLPGFQNPATVLGTVAAVVMLISGVGAPMAIISAQGHASRFLGIRNEGGDLVPPPVNGGVDFFDRWLARERRR